MFFIYSTKKYYNKFNTLIWKYSGWFSIKPDIKRLAKKENKKEGKVL